MTAPAPEPVCRHCGADADNLHSIERAVSWRYVDWQYSPAAPDGHSRAGWYPGDQWGDDVGDTTAESVGIACGSCYAEVWYEARDNADGRDHDAGELITTRAAYNRTHPLRRWRVKVKRIDDPGDSGTEWQHLPDGTMRSVQVREPRPTTYQYRTVTVEAHDAREALAEASQHGMVRGRYPWRPVCEYCRIGANKDHPDHVQAVA